MSGRSTRLFRVGLVAAVTVLSGAIASSQMPENPSVVRTYGAGVHAFFSGDFDRSYDEFTAAIEAGLDDPRARYFRGLAALRLGRLDEAEADFSDGADLEARGAGGWPVSQSLERVQGHDRLRLERHRVRARVANIQRIKAAEMKRLRETEAAQPGVLRNRAPEAVAVPRSDGTNPFADQNEAGAGDSGEASPPNAPDPLPGTETPAAGTDGVAGGGLDAEMEKPADTPADTPAEAVDAKPDAAGEDESPLTNPADEPASGESEPPMVEQPGTTDPASPPDPAPSEPAPSEPTTEPAPAEPATPEPGAPEPATPEPATPEPGSPEPTTGEPANPAPGSSKEDPFGDKEGPPPAAGADAPMAEDKKDEAAADGQ